MRRYVAVGLVGGLLQSLLLMTTHVNAASTGITVTPAFVKAELSENTSVQDVTIGVRNDFSAPVQLLAEVKGLAQKGRLLVPNDRTDMSLAQALSVSPSEFVLAPKQSLNVKLHITNIESMTPGSHVGSLQIKQISDSGRKLSVQPGIAVALFVTKHGGEVQRVAINDFTTPRSLFSLPTSSDVTLQSTGNTIVIPRGRLSVGDRSGSVVLKGIINQESVPLLPGSQVTLRAPLDSVARAWLPGRYSFNAQVRFDGSDTYITKTVRFLYIPVWTLVVSMLAIAAGALLAWRRKYIGKQLGKRFTSKKAATAPTVNSIESTQINTPKKSKKITIKSD